MLYIGGMTTTLSHPVASTPLATGNRTSPAPTIRRALGVLALRPALLLVAALAILALTADASTLLYLNLVIIAVDAITLAVLARLQRAAGRRLRDLVGPIRPVDIAWSMLVFLIVTVGFLVATYAGNLIAYRGAPPVPTTAPTVPLWIALITLAVMPVTVALAEELAYRGYAQSALTARWGRWSAVLTMALFFGLQHVPLSLESPQAALARFITTALAGVMFGLLVWWLRRLTPLIAAHWLLNVLFLGLPLVMLAVAS